MTPPIVRPDHAHYCSTCDGYAPCYGAPELDVVGHCILRDSCPVCELVPSGEVVRISKSDNFSSREVI